MKRHIIAIFTLMMTLLALPAVAQDSDTLAVRTHRWFSLHDIKVEGRVGFNIGGTAPLGMPATIRHLDKFSLTPNISFGVSATKQFNPKWGLKVGINFENKGMKTDARVKNYSMEIVRGGQTLGGWFTGNVVTSVTQWMFTLPIQATMMARKVRLRGGLYASYLTYRDFSGWAYDGYLRVDGPTGEKVSLGHNEGERGEYDFSWHHYDDVIETILMGMLHGAQIQTMMPKLHSTNFEGMQLIRPLYLIRESDICAWRDYNELRFLQCACHFTETCSTCHEDGTTSSKRLDTKKLIAELKKTNPFVESNIFRSVENVNLDTVIEYKKGGVRHNFLDEY